MKILALETATEACSAALLIDGEVRERYEVAPRAHARLLLPMLEGLLAEAELKPMQLDAIAFGRGPGSFTGVRIAASVAQGIAFAADLPVLPVSTLAALAWPVLRVEPDSQVFAAIDRDDFNVATFVTAARSGLDALTGLSITGAQAKAIVDTGEPLFRELEEQSVGLAVEVQLNVASKGAPVEWRRLEDLSKGQRATALLLLLLGASMSPLVIDQPEDDLDNRFVYDGVVQKLRSLKGTRQLIVSTHNANVPVLGDAELVVTLEADGQHGRTATDGVGSLDNPKVRKYAEDLLEGGRTAFDARKRLYDF